MFVDAIFQAQVSQAFLASHAILAHIGSTHKTTRNVFNMCNLTEQQFLNILEIFLL